MPAPPNAAPPSRRARFLVALAIGALAAAFTGLLARGRALPPDFGVTWRGAQALLAGLDPYTAVGPGRRFGFDFPLLYPMPAVLLVAPLAGLHSAVARAAFAGVTFALATFGITRRAWYPLATLTSRAALGALLVTQWSAGLAAAVALPAAAWLVAAKPNIGLAVAASWHSRRQWAWGVAGSVLLATLSFALVPGWLGAWLGTLESAPHIRAPIQASLAAPLLLLGLLRWRRPEARMLVVLACVPHTPAYYDALPLLVLVLRRPNTRGDVAVARVAAPVASGPELPAGGAREHAE